MRKILVTVSVLMVVAAAVVWGATTFKPSAQSRSGAAVAYVKADMATGVLKSFGGKGTTGVVVSDLNTNLAVIEFTFTGKYPKNITTDDVILNVTHESSSTFGVVADARVFEASPTQMVIRVEQWESDTLAGVADPVFLTVYLGQTL